MNTRSLVATMAPPMLAGTSVAAEYTNFPIEPSTTSRADVRAEAQAARQARTMTGESSARHNTGNYVGG